MIMILMMMMMMMMRFFSVSDTGGMKEKIRVLLTGVETVTYWFLFQMMII